MKNIVCSCKDFLKLFDVLHYLLLQKIDNIEVYISDYDHSFKKEYNWITKYFCLLSNDITFNKGTIDECENVNDIDITNKNRNVLFTTVCTDNYLPGLKVLLRSCIKNINNFDYDFRVFYNNDCQSLTNDHKQELLEIYPNIEFEGINEKEFDIRRGTKPTRLTKNCYLSFYFFKDYGYDYNVFLDCDMIVNRDFTYLLNNAKDLIGSYDQNEPKFKPKIWTIYNLTNKRRINSGFIIIDKSYMNEDIFNELIEITNNTDLIINNDQCSINYLIKERKRTVLPYHFNNQVRVCIELEIEDSPIKDFAYIHHYIGAVKPWMKDKDFSILESEWLKYK